MKYSRDEVLKFVEENDVKFIRLAFCDIRGKQKNIAVMPSELSRVFDCGIPFDASLIKGFPEIEQSDLLLYPDPSTLTILPWRPTHGRVARFFCDIRYPDKRRFECDFRYFVQKAVDRLRKMGYICKIGAKSEFYLFNLDENGMPTKIPFDNAGYLDIAPLDKGENIRREICLTLEEMGIQPESSRHKQGPGQNEIDFRHDAPITTADNFITYKSVVKTMAARSGAHASFMPKPFVDKSGSGFHWHITLYRNDENIFEKLTPQAKSFTEGVLEKIKDMTVFLNPLTNSYARFGDFEAPKYVAWAQRNRSQLVRIPLSRTENMRMEIRSADPACNPYIALTLLLNAGADGIEKQLKLREPIENTLSKSPVSMLENLDALPSSLTEAIEIAEKSEFLKKYLPEVAINAFLNEKRTENMQYLQSDDKHRFEESKYFRSI
ncbi:MAG: type I glutamate--ammonia ligase [Clostridiales bacterium]|nr:MAG: type I glutamate--ammonia ligase [Clostridiales bacterium]